jgi:hypothetical protein
VKLPSATIVRAAVAALGMYLAVVRINPSHHLATVAARMLAGAPIYLGLIALIDPDARLLLAKAVARLRRMAGGGVA